MYGFIKGVVDTVEVNSCVVDCNGVGYIVYATSTLLGNIKVGDIVKIITHTLVKEDDISIFGFCDSSEKAMFLKLTSITGVGAKSAIGILSNISVTDLALGIINRDLSILTSVKGVGKKTAERIILELKDKFDAEVGYNDKIEKVNSIGVGTEAQQALVALGFKFNEAIKMLEGIEGSTTEELITKALRNKG